MNANITDITTNKNNVLENLNLINSKSDTIETNKIAFLTIKKILIITQIK